MILNSFLFFFLLAFGVICKFCTFLYVSNKLLCWFFCIYFILKKSSSQTGNETSGLSSWAPRGNRRGREKDWKGCVICCLKAGRRMVCPPHLGARTLEFFSAREGSAEGLSVTSNSVNHYQWHCQQRKVPRAPFMCTNVNDQQTHREVEKCTRPKPACCWWALTFELVTLSVVSVWVYSRWIYTTAQSPLRMQPEGPARGISSGWTPQPNSWPHRCPRHMERLCSHGHIWQHFCSPSLGYSYKHVCIHTEKWRVFSMQNTPLLFFFFYLFLLIRELGNAVTLLSYYATQPVSCNGCLQAVSWICWQEPCTKNISLLYQTLWTTCQLRRWGARLKPWLHSSTFCRGAGRMEIKPQGLFLIGKTMRCLKQDRCN